MNFMMLESCSETPPRVSSATTKKPLKSPLHSADSHMAHLVQIVLFTWAFVFLSGAGGQTAPQSASGRLESIQVSGSARFHSDQIVSAIGLKPGQTMTREDMQKGADLLAQLGPFSSVKYQFSSVKTDVKLEYQVTDAPALPVSFDNFPWFTDDELAAALKSSVILFDGRAPDHGTILDTMSATLEKQLRARGVYATVSHEVVVALGGDHSEVQFRIEGAQLNVENVQFSDSLARTDRGIEERLSDIIGKPFSRSAFELFEFEQVRPVYLSHAFLHVQFGPPNARFAGDTNQPVPNQVVIVAPIEPGPAFAWNGALWAGNRAITSADLDKLAELRPGDFADEMKVEATWPRVREAYARLGYIEASVNAVPQFDDVARRVTYAVSITEGPQYHMGDLVLTGLSLEGERRIRIAWSIPTGAVFDESLYNEFLAHGISRAFVGMPVHYDKIGRFLETDPKTGRVDVMLDFQ
jgi:outer membrane protein insertion porin family